MMRRTHIEQSNSYITMGICNYYSESLPHCLPSYIDYLEPSLTLRSNSTAVVQDTLPEIQH